MGGGDEADEEAALADGGVPDEQDLEGAVVAARRRRGALPNPSRRRGLGNGGSGSGRRWRRRWRGQKGAGDGGAAAPAAKLGSLTVEVSDFAQVYDFSGGGTCKYLRAVVGAAEVISRSYS